MKFWELTSFMRDDKESLINILKTEKWKEYFDWYNKGLKFKIELPDELCKEVIKKSKNLYQINEGFLRKKSGQKENEKTFTALEIFNMYGGECLEEVEEYGSWECPNK